MAVQMHYHDDQTMIRRSGNTDVVVLPDHMFVRTAHMDWIEEDEPHDYAW